MTHRRSPSPAPVPTRSRARRALAAGTACAALAGVVSVSGSPAQALVRPGADGRIVMWYDSPDDGSSTYDLVTIASDGTDLRTIVDTGDVNVPVMDVGHPTWSPDGSQIAFVGQARENTWWQVFVVDSDGSDLHLLTYDVDGQATSPMGVWNIDWAADGRIWMSGDFSVLASYDPATREYIDHPTEIGGICGGYCANPSVSPDGTLLAFSDWTNVMVAPVDDLTNRTTVMTGNAHVTWTPDGKVAAMIDKNLGIAKADPVENATVTRLTTSGMSPAFAPSGSSMIFLRKSGGTNVLWRADADGSNEVNLSVAWGLTGKMGAMDWYSVQDPGTVTAPAVLNIGRGLVRASWATATGGTLSPTAYTVAAYDTPSGVTPARTCTTTGSRTCDLKRLAKGTTYWVSVTATVYSIDSAASPRTSITTWGAPTKPLGLSAKGLDRSVKATWSAPAANGGTKVTGYVVEVFASKTAVKPAAVCRTELRRCTVTKLDAGDYWVSVRATNAVGVGASAPRVKVTVA